ncbi:site-specific recombinase XerD [Rhizobium sp. PP-CC-2G-626]|nr:site-specific recombinase XerD [Rhizobium sp. PP-CC-2G-626]
MTLEDAAVRYMTEVADGQPSRDDSYRSLQRLMAFIGSSTRMDAITDQKVAAFVAHRKKQPRFGRKTFADKRPMPPISGATVNRDVAVLKRLFVRSRKTWKITLPNEPDWTAHRLDEAKERTRELHVEEDIALEDAVRPDYAPWLAFAKLSGVRLNETLIEWSQVNFFAKRISTVGKGGRPVYIEMTPAICALLEPLRGNHPVSVFTFVALRTNKPKGLVRGQHYPISYHGAKTEWQRLRKRSGVTDFRFHDIRHDFATKLLRATGNLKIVSKALNHSDISVTAKYAHVDRTDVREAMELAERERSKTRKKTGTGQADVA